MILSLMYLMPTLNLIYILMQFYFIDLPNSPLFPQFPIVRRIVRLSLEEKGFFPGLISYFLK